MMDETVETDGFWSELRHVVQRSRQAWDLVPGTQKAALAVAFVMMCGSSAANTAIPICLGRLVESVNPESHHGRGLDAASLTRIVAIYLGMIGLAYIVREALHVLRRFLVENACTRIDRDLCVRVVGHLMQVDLAALAHEQVGALHGRITRSVDGVVRYLRLGFLDFLPALLTGGFALAAALSKQPRVALVMMGVIPISVALTLRQLVTQKGVRVQLMKSREAMDGTVVEQLGGLDYVRAANTHAEEVSASRARPSTAAAGNSATTSRCRSSDAEKPSTRASSTYSSSPMQCTCSCTAPSGSATSSRSRSFT